MAGLDFIVIGVQKGGTTSLWQYLRHHPSIAMPATKEEPFFSTPAAAEPGALDAFVRDRLPARDGRLLGKSTPPYMLGSGHADVEEIAARIAAACPEVRLIALLRDPIERAFAQWRMSVRQGIEYRSFDAAVEEQLRSETLQAERRRPTRPNSYVVAGEYGRILGAYRARFPAERLHVEMSADLAGDPAATIDRVLGFLGLPAGYRPEGLGVPHNRGGRRLDGLGEAELFDFLERRVWPALGGRAAELKAEFERFYERWSEIPELGRVEPPPVEASTRERLREHYEEDAARLGGLGIEARWTERWSVAG